MGGGEGGRSEDGGWEEAGLHCYTRTGGSWTGEAHWSHGEKGEGGGVCPPSSRSEDI